MSAPLPTPGEVEGMRERHVPTDLGRVEVCCQGCEDTSDGCVPWPCDAARLLALVDHEHRHGLAWVSTVVERDARLDAVIAECDLLDEQTSGYVSTDRIRRAATGGTP